MMEVGEILIWSGFWCLVTFVLAFIFRNEEQYPFDTEKGNEDMRVSLCVGVIGATILGMIALGARLTWWPL